MNGSKHMRHTKRSGVLISLLLLLLSRCQLNGALDSARLNPRELPLTGPVAGVAGSLLYANGLVLRSYEISTGAFRDLATFPTDSYADHPAVSPDASTIAFTLYHANRGESDPENGADLMLMNVDGTNQRVLVAHALPGEWLTDAAWSADGATLFFTREHPAGPPRIERMHIDSRERDVVVAKGHSPSLSADGPSLAFLRDEAGGGQGLYVATLDGGSPLAGVERAIVIGERFDQLAAPRFSPAGSQIAFAGVGGPPPTAQSKPAPPSPGWGWLGARSVAAHGVPWEVWTVDADGGNLRKLTDLAEDAPMPLWSPDGTGLALKGELGLYLIDPATGSARRLVQELAGDGIAWLP